MTSNSLDEPPIRPAKPPSPRAELIPAELKFCNQWVVWMYELRDGRWTKVPYQPARPNLKARSNDPSTWSAFDIAWNVYQSGGFDGIGFQFCEDDPYFGVDIDNCLGAEQLAPWAAPIVERLKPTYGEISPSGRGIKFIAKGKLPDGKGTRRAGMGPDGTGNLEIYDRKRFFTITGSILNDARGILELPDIAIEIYQMVKAGGKSRGGAGGTTGSQSNSSDRQLLEKARRAKNGAKFTALFDRGDISEYDGNDSDADLALMSILAFWTGRDAVRMESLFGRSALGGREKWNTRPDYRSATIAEANRSCEVVYDPVRRRRNAAAMTKKGEIGRCSDDPFDDDERPRDDRPSIEMTTERHIMLEKAIEALTRDGELFVRGHTLGVVRGELGSVAVLSPGVEFQKARGSFRFTELSAPNVGCFLTRNATFYQWKKDRAGEDITVHVHPPAWLIDAVWSCKSWPGIRLLLSIAQCPYVRLDGSIATAGYDTSTGALYRPTFELVEFPGNPTEQDAIDAAARLVRPVSQFPFATDFDRQVWLAALLTAIQRPMIGGPVPGFAFNGNKAGCGKGLLIDAIGRMVWGHDIPTRSYPVDPVEAGKVKLSLGISAVSVVHFDNLPEGCFYGNSELDSALTSTLTEGRILGQSRESGPVPLRPCWYLSGNNLSPSKDAYRRWLPCNLQTPLELPHERNDIDIKNLRQYIAEHRAELIRDALIILRAHALAGHPTGDWAPLGSFEEWDTTVRGAVWFATGLDCLHTQRRTAEEAPERMDKLALLEGWSRLPDGCTSGATVEQALRVVTENPESHPALHGAFMRMSRDGKLPGTRSIGNKIRAMREENVGGMWFAKTGERNHSAVWVVEKA